MTVNEVVDLVIALNNTGPSLKSCSETIEKNKSAFGKLKESAKQENTYKADQMEKDIWVMWMSTLEEDSNILDLDAIENHLKSLGIVDFGDYTFDAEENEAIRDAKSKAAAIRERQQEATSVGNAKPMDAAEGEEPGSTKKPPSHGAEPKD